MNEVDALIGAPYSSTSEKVSLIAATWNIPVVAYSATSPSLADKELYPTFSRVPGSTVYSAPLYTKVYIISFASLHIKVFFCLLS